MIIHGRKIIVSSGGTAIAAAKSCDLEVSCETVPVASPSIGSWRTLIPGQKSWNVKTSHLVTGIKGMVLDVGSTVNISIYDDDNPSDALSGTAIVTSCQVSSQVGALAKGSFAFEGSGPLS